jgi:hypothetical protein
MASGRKKAWAGVSPQELIGTVQSKLAKAVGLVFELRKLESPTKVTGESPYDALTSILEATRGVFPAGERVRRA